MAASTEPEQRLECLPNTKEENFRPLGSSGLHESRVFLITDSQSNKRTRKSGPSRSVFILKHHTTTPKDATRQVSQNGLRNESHLKKQHRVSFDIGIAGCAAIL
jgi:hypothetical protein